MLSILICHVIWGSLELTHNSFLLLASKCEWEFIAYTYSCNHFPYCLITLPLASFQSALHGFPLFHTQFQVMCAAIMWCFIVMYHLEHRQTVVVHRACKLGVKLTEHFLQRFASLIRMKHNNNLGCLTGHGVSSASREILILHEEVSHIMIDSCDV